MVFSKLLALSLLLFLCTPSVVSSVVNENRFRNGQIESGFALMELRDVGEEKAAMELCVNFQQFEKRPVPEGSFHLVRWDSSGLNLACGPPTKPQQFDGNELLQLVYFTSTDELGELCEQNKTELTLKGGPVEFQVSNAENAGIKTILFLNLGSDIKDAHLHSKFCNLKINGRTQDNGTNIFYIYYDAFYEHVTPKLRASRDRLEFRFRRPSHYFDLGLPLLWILCLIAVALGSIWSAKAAAAHLLESTERLQQQQQQQISENQGAIDSETAEIAEANKEKKMPRSLKTFLIWTFVTIASLCLMHAGFLLGTHAQSIALVSLLWATCGIFCMSKCLFALCKYVLCPKRYGQQKPFFEYRGIRLTGLDLLCYLLSAAICLPWPFLSHWPWSFALLDLMSVASVVYLIKYISYETLRKKKKHLSPRVQLILTTIMFICGIFWFIFMHSAESKCGPLAPINSEIEVREIETFFGGLLMPMLNDPLAACWDTQIETGFRSITIPVFSFLFPAAVTVPFWFHVDFVNGRRSPYGIAALFGFSLGLLFVLLYMFYFSSLHWLLAYLLLMPWSIYAVLILALVKGTFKQLLKGETDHQI